MARVPSRRARAAPSLARSRNAVSPFCSEYRYDALVARRARPHRRAPFSFERGTHTHMRRATTNGEGWSRKKWGWLTTVLSFIVMGVGVAAWSYFQCVTSYPCVGGYPYRDIGLLAMIFGGVMFVVGIVLLLISAQHL